MRTLILTLSLFFIFSSFTGETQAAPVNDRTVVVIRILSSTNCIPCNQVQQNLLSENYITQRTDYLYRGTMRLFVNGTQIDARLEQIEMNLLPSSETFYPAIDSNISFYPTFQVYVNGTKAYSGEASGIGSSSLSGFTGRGLKAHVESFLSRY